MYGVTILLSATSTTALVLASVDFGVSYPLPVQTMALLAAIAFFVFPGLAERSYTRWRRRIDDKIPSMLSDVSGSIRNGFNLPRALELAADSEYGPLTEQLRLIRVQLSWGLTFQEAMSNQVKRVDSQLAKRTFTALMQAGSSGGHIQDVLDAIQRHTTELHDLDKEKRGALRPYVTTTYLAVGIFLTIAVVLMNSFFGQIFATQQRLGTTTASVFVGLGGLSLPALKQAFLQMGLIEAVFGGLGAGKLGEASFAAGFKHVIILVSATVIVFTVLVR
jgi:flagellar protein FlaJ